MPAGRGRTARAVTSVAILLATTAMPAGGVVSPSASVALRVEAGLGGAAKPGRWTPVRVAIQADRPGAAEMIVEWGSAVFRRPVELGGEATSRTFEVYVQTMAPAATASVRLVSDGQEIAAASVPVQVLRADDTFILCVDAVEDEDCTVRQPAATLPRSLRGYDAADAVVSSGGGRLDARQRQALSQWRSWRALEIAGSLAATDRPRSVLPTLTQHGRTPGYLRVWMGAYVAVLLVTGLLLIRRRASATTSLAAIVLLVVGGTLGAAAAGRAGPGTDVIIHHGTLVQQLPGAGGSIVTMNGVIEYPGLDHYAVRVDLSDAAFEPTTRPGVQAAQASDLNGQPVVAGTYGLGARQPFTLSGVSTYAPLEIARRGTAIRVTNTLPIDLACRPGDGFSSEGDRLLRAGSTLLLPADDQLVGPVITCAVPEAPITFSAPGRSVQTTGRTTLAGYVLPSPVDRTAGS